MPCLPHFITLTQTQFDKLKFALAQSNEVTVTSSTDVVGVLTTDDVDLSYSFLAASNLLSISILKRHSLAAKLASESIIYSHVDDMLNPFIKENQ